MQRYGKEIGTGAKRCCVNDTLLLRMLRFVFFFDVSGKIGKEVPPQEKGNADKQTGVDALFLEQAVDVGTVAGELARKPRDATLLPLQFFLYKDSDGFHCKEICAVETPQVRRLV